MKNASKWVQTCQWWRASSFPRVCLAVCRQKATLKFCHFFDKYIEFIVKIQCPYFAWIKPIYQNEYKQAYASTSCSRNNLWHCHTSNFPYLTIVASVKNSHKFMQRVSLDVTGALWRYCSQKGVFHCQFHDTRPVEGFSQEDVLEV